MSESYFGLTDTGLVRTNNEDAFLLQPLEGGRLLACVIDGVGGYEGGEVAARIARDAFAAAAGSIKGGAGALAAVFPVIETAMGNAKTRQPELAQMACVLTALLVDEAAATFYYAHVGDTRLYLYRDASLVKISQDHSFVGMLEDSGRITEAEALAHPKRNEVDRALGFGAIGNDAGAYVETGDSPFLPGDLLLLCSDGLTDLLTRAEIAAHLQAPVSLEQKAGALVRAANEKGGKDNITVVLVAHRSGRSGPAPVGQPRKVERKPEPAEIPEKPVYTPAPARQARVSPWPWIAAALLLVVAAWWLLRKKDPEVPVAPAPSQPPTLVQALAAGGDTLLLDQVNNTSGIALPDTVRLERDTLHLVGRDTTLLRPEAGHTVLQVAPTVKLLSFGRLELRDADIRVSSSNVSALRFDSVRLRNVSIGVAHPLFFRDTIITGALYSTYKKGGARD
ncbi:PP2C family protein-serine/threonine phosphatase [Flaviaesturariibacter flavus]|nr:protein phosphatase 2C domain-containing protein [Flaviaesturariibacter flavus]